MSDKTYLNGSVREVVFQDGNSLLSVWIDLDDAKEKGLFKKTKNGEKTGIAFTIAKRSEEGKYGDTHYMYHKEYDPNKGKKSAPQKATPQAPKQDDGDDLPF